MGARDPRLPAGPRQREQQVLAEHGEERAGVADLLADIEEAAFPLPPDEFATPEITIAPTYCADVMNSDNVSGQPVWLYRTNDGAKDYHWYEVPVTCGDLTCLCGEANCIEFEDVQNPSLCLALSSNLTGISLINYQLVGVMGGTARAAWIQIGNNLENFFMPGHYLSVNGPLYSGRYLYIQIPIAPGGNVWQQWSGP